MGRLKFSQKSHETLWYIKALTFHRTGATGSFIYTCHVWQMLLIRSPGALLQLQGL